MNTYTMYMRERTRKRTLRHLLLKYLLPVVAVFLALPFFCLSGTVSIVAPCPCAKLDRVEDDRIYLKVAEDVCAHGSGLINAQVKDGINEASVYLDGVFLKRQKVDTFDMDDILRFKAKAGQEEKALKVPTNIHREKAESLAKDADTYYKSGEFQAKLKAETARLRKRLGVEGYHTGPEKKTPFYSDYRDRSKPSLAGDERIYIFISSSMPVHTVRNYTVSAGNLMDRNIVFVMRGFINGAKYIMPTMSYLAQVMKKHEACDLSTGKCRMLGVNVMVDPLLFAKYGIERVPSFVYARGVKVTDAEMSEGLGGNASVSGYYKLSGDAGLDHVLERFHEETESASIRGLLSALGRGFYGENTKENTND